MALNDRLKHFLAQQKIEYDTLPHREVFTAQEVAATTHVPGRQLAKVILVREDGKGYLMAVLPASCRLDVSTLTAVSGKRKLSLAGEDEVGRVFPDCEIGAMPPFGNLYDLPVYVDACFPREKELYFQAGNHHEVVRMRYGEYERLVRPVAGEFCLHEGPDA
jgi:Ala-tRNA(Pro) deacylase